MVLLKFALFSLSFVFANEMRLKLADDLLRKYNFNPKDFKVGSETACLGDDNSFGAEIVNPIKVMNTIIKPGSSIAFCEGKIYYYGLENKEILKFDGISCTNTVSVLNGKLCQCDLAEDIMAKGIKILATSTVHIENGEVKYFVTGKSWKTGKYNVVLGSYSWDKNGELRKDPIPDMINTCEEDD